MTKGGQNMELTKEQWTKLLEESVEKWNERVEYVKGRMCN